jgi:hypothetical protein
MVRKIVIWQAGASTADTGTTREKRRVQFSSASWRKPGFTHNMKKNLIYDSAVMYILGKKV